MKRFFIETAKCGITKGGMTCGPVPGHVVVTIKFIDDSTAKWLSLVEVEGIPNVLLLDKDIHEALVAEDFEDKEFTEYLNAHFINEFEGITFDDSYFTTFAEIAEDPDNPAVPLIRYLITLVRCDMNDVEELINMAVGRYADELTIPTSDVEEDFMDENEDVYSS